MNSLIIGIAGGSGSGKTSVTNQILKSLDAGRVAVIQHDAYYHDIDPSSPGKIPSMNFDHPDSLETSLLIRHLREMRQGRSVEVPIYDFTTYRRKPVTRHVEATEVVIVEGILIFVSKELRDQMDIRIFVDADSDERLLRRIKRDIKERGRSVESIMEQYLATVKPMHLEFVEPSKRWADIIVPRGVENTVAIDMVVTKVRSMISQGVKSEM